MDGWGGRNKPPLPVVGYLLAARDRFFGLWADRKVERFTQDRANDRDHEAVDARLLAHGRPYGALGDILVPPELRITCPGR